MNSDEIMQALKPFGHCRVFQMNDGWSAACELFIQGMEAKVHSDFKHPTMNSALIQLHSKVLDMVENLVDFSKKLPPERKKLS